jgi:hypothetical protein
MRSLSCAVNVRRRGRSDNSGDAEAAGVTTVGLRLSFLEAPASGSILTVSGIGIYEIILPRPQG